MTMSELAQWKCFALVLLAAGCSSSKSNSDGGTSEDSGASSPTSITWAKVANQSSAMATAVTANGGIQYFTAFDSNDNPGVWSVVVGAQPTTIYSGAPLAMPAGLAISADDSTLYVADVAASTTLADGGVGNDQGVVWSIPAAGGAPTAIPISGLVQPQAVSVSSDGTSLLVSGWDSTGAAGVFRVAATGGTMTPIAQAGLTDPGEASDVGGAVWVAEHRAVSGYGSLVRYSGGTGTDMSNDAIQLGFPGSLVASADGKTMYLAYLGRDGGAILYTDAAGSGAGGQVTLKPAGTVLTYPSGLSRGRGVNVFGISDGEGSAANVYNGR
jgi:hypothetical protein